MVDRRARYYWSKYGAIRGNHEKGVDNTPQLLCLGSRRAAEVVAEKTSLLVGYRKNRVLIINDKDRENLGGVVALAFALTP